MFNSYLYNIIFKSFPAPAEPVLPTVVSEFLKLIQEILQEIIQKIETGKVRVPQVRQIYRES